MGRGLRRPAILLLSLAAALLLTTGARAVTVTVTTVDGYAKVTWTQPSCYPDAYVDYIEIATTSTVDGQGFFPIDDLVDYTFFLEASESTGTWQSDFAQLEPGTTYYAHVEEYRESENTTGWSTIVAFTVGGPASVSSPSAGTCAPTGDPVPPTATPPPGSGSTPSEPAPAPTETSTSQPAGDANATTGTAPVSGTDYLTRLRVTGSALVIGFREARQPVDEFRRYRVCWTERARVRCQKRTTAAGAWDDLRLQLRPSLGRVRNGRRSVEVTWAVGGELIAVRRVGLPSAPA